MFKHFLVIGLVIFGLVSCNKNNSESQEQGGFVHKQASIQRQACVGKDSTCAEVGMNFPQFSGEDRKLVSWLNLHVKEQLLMYLQWGEASPQTDSVEVAAEMFLEGFKDMAREYPATSLSWFLKTDGEVVFENSEAISLMFTNSSFTGGAHPNYTVLFMNIDLEAPRLLKNDDLVLDQPALLQKAKIAFRGFHEVDSQVSLKEDGRFFLDDGKFFLPAAMGYEGDEFVMVYNSYEIGPYSMGLTELRFPLEELEGIVWMPGQKKDPTN
ncbi:hypothetical protein DN752_06580 [Echinicola strongylocentroti]|uniref:DUF3298 domain-containing protein n=1 Tax=Echinicola strongylocentroti TaxID=1795355 RepID=A0A2Z4IFD4_9BACT|nr:DUF3298 and DUF4163 domain-containing protein [Echinicola strongylocentroti]AWW29811.1 hypothetical protein DN752_06580 [Echinicola strongylocentroti]